MAKHFILFVFLVIVTLTLGHEAHHNQTNAAEKNVTQASSQQILEKLEKEENDGSLDWSNESIEERNPDYAVDDPAAGIFDHKDLTQEQQENRTISSQPALPLSPRLPDSSSSSAVLASSTQESTSIDAGESTDESASSGTTTSSTTQNFNGTSSTGTETTATTSSSQETSNSTSSTSTSEGVSITEVSSPNISSSTEKKSPSPSPITTQDYGDVSNNTTPVFREDNEDGEPTGLRAWAVVLISVFISFAVIFTILYFIRAAIIRRRKDDQRRLLRASISSEGFFHGDGEGNLSGKFEL